MTIAEKNDVRLRHATEEDLLSLDEITIVCYEPIQESFVSIVGETFSSAVCSGDWKDRKIKQVRDLFGRCPENVWVLERDRHVFGYLTFMVNLEKSIGVIDNNGILPAYRGQGWGTFMYRRLIAHFKNQGLRIALVETDLDDPHIPARRAYEAVGFNRQHRIVNYIQDLTEISPGSESK